MDIKTNYEDYTISGEELFCQKQVITQSNIDVSQKGEISKILFNEEKNVLLSKESRVSACICIHCPQYSLLKWLK